MSNLRTGLIALTTLLLGAGYAASQRAFFSGEASQWAERVDSPPVKALAGVLFVAALLLMVVRDKGDRSEKP